MRYSDGIGGLKIHKERLDKIEELGYDYVLCSVRDDKSYKNNKKENNNNEVHIVRRSSDGQGSNS